MAEMMDVMLTLNKSIVDLQAELRHFRKTRLEIITDIWADGQDVMQALHISPRTLQHLRTTGKLPYSRINGKFYYLVADVEHLLNENYLRFKKHGHDSR